MEEIGKSVQEKRRITLKEAINKVYRELDDDLGIEENRRNAERDLHNFIEVLTNFARDRLARRYSMEEDYSSENLQLYHEDGCCNLDPLGEIFLDGSKKIINLFYELLSDMENHISHKGGMYAGKIRIGAIHTLSVHPVPMIIHEFNTMHTSSAAFKVITGSSSQIKEMLCNRIIDVGFVSEKVQSYSGYSSLRIRPFEKPLCICPKSSINRFIDKSGALSNEGLAEVNKLPLIYFTNVSTWRSRMEKWIADGNLEPSPVLFESDSMEVIMSMVDKGIGRGVVPSKVLYRDKGRLSHSNIFCYKIIDEKLITSIIVLNKPDELTKKFIEFIQERGYSF